MRNEKIAIIGGTGKEGKGLAYRWLQAGYNVIIGSRSTEKALQAVMGLKELVPSEIKQNIDGKMNEAASEEADIIVITIPFAFHRDILETIKPFAQGKVVLDVTVPLVPPKVSTVQIPYNGSAALFAQDILGENVKVISAFQNISFELLLGDKPIECDVLVCGTDKATRELGVRLVSDVGLTGWDAGPLENSIVAEGLTSVLIRINKKYGSLSAGIRITGIEK
ncbi:MAG: NADPH-dependent F420 reductase [Pelolinea sp.]|nr:NADPH-dependent F420 reductase [Pelolinea sp.]